MGHTSLALESEEDHISVNPVSASRLDTREASFRPWSFNGVSSCPWIIPATLLLCQPPRST